VTKKSRLVEGVQKDTFQRLQRSIPTRVEISHSSSEKGPIYSYQKRLNSFKKSKFFELYGKNFFFFKEYGKNY